MDDRCSHVPVSPGQSMCRCEDTRMLLELVIACQARYIDLLVRRFEKGEPRIIDPAAILHGD